MMPNVLSYTWLLKERFAVKVTLGSKVAEITSCWGRKWMPLWSAPLVRALANLHQHQIRRQCTVNPAHLHICICKRSEEEGLCLLHDLCGCLKRGEEREGIYGTITFYCGQCWSSLIQLRMWPIFQPHFPSKFWSLWVEIKFMMT